MPVSTPSIKWRNVQRLGAKVVLHGQDFDAAKAECLRLATAHGLTFIPPYDNPYVIAGQGTIGMEICRQVPDVDSLDGIFAAIGGGGLLAGIGAYTKRIARPSVGLFGVETVDGDAMEQSVREGKRVTLDEVGPFADGTAVRLVGEEPFRLVKNLVDGFVLVNNDEICAAIKDVFEGGQTSLVTLQIASRESTRAPSLQRPGEPDRQRPDPCPSLPGPSPWPASRRTLSATTSSAAARSLSPSSAAAT